MSARVRSAVRWSLFAILVASCTADGGGGSGANGRKTAASDAGVKPVPVQTDVAAEDYVMPPLPRAKVVLPDVYGGKHLVEAALQRL